MRSANTTSWLEFGNGSGRSKTPSTIEKIAVVAPIPNASMSTAVAVKPGDLPSCRNANLRSGRRFCRWFQRGRRVLQFVLNHYRRSGKQPLSGKADRVSTNEQQPEEQAHPPSTRQTSDALFRSTLTSGL